MRLSGLALATSPGHRRLLSTPLDPSRDIHKMPLPVVGKPLINNDPRHLTIDRRVQSSSGCYRPCIKSRIAPSRLQMPQHQLSCTHWVPFSLDDLRPHTGTANSSPHPHGQDIRKPVAGRETGLAGNAPLMHRPGEPAHPHAHPIGKYRFSATPSTFASTALNLASIASSVVIAPLSASPPTRSPPLSPSPLFHQNSHHQSDGGR